ncbi:probable glycosyltransferase At5g20260 [Nymphaea colorata]|nr:probable glycosyltransferase At5g20260 [Nymphaea colorata]
MKEYITAVLLLFILIFSVAVINSNTGGKTSPVLTFLLSPATSSTSGYLKTASDAPATRKWRKDGKTGRWEKMEEGLARSRASIRRAILERNCTSRKRQSYIPSGSIYHNPYAFHQSYIEMEKRLKIWIYKEGEPPMFHEGPCGNIYSIEGQFISEMDENGPFVTRNPEEALVYFLPFSVVRMVGFVYEKGSLDRQSLPDITSDYIQVISAKYPYWNRTHGADHFMLSCHDWAPYATIGRPVFKNLIRVLCNANSSEGFFPTRDAPLPEFNMGHKLPVPVVDPSPLSAKTMLAFFAGGNHGVVRKILFKEWKDKDPQVQIFEYLPKGLDYGEFLRKTKYCLCPSGYEVASPRITESILAGCIPVPISDSYVLPFSDVLDWTQFSVPIPVSRIPEIKEILRGIPESTYLKLQANVLKVQGHFAVNRPAKRFDVMHMLLHSIWLRRLNLGLEDV